MTQPQQLDMLACLELAPIWHESTPDQGFWACPICYNPKPRLNVDPWFHSLTFQPPDYTVGLCKPCGYAARFPVKFGGIHKDDQVPPDQVWQITEQGSH